MAGEQTPETLESPAPPEPQSWAANILRQPLSLLQTLVGIMAGLLTIGGAFFSVSSVGSRPPQGEIVTLVQDRASRRPIANATVEILTREDALVTSLSVEPDGRLARRLREGQYRVRVSHPAFATEIRQVEVHAGQRSEVPIALGPRPAARVVRTVSAADSPGPLRKFFKDLGF